MNFTTFSIIFQKDDYQLFTARPCIITCFERIHNIWSYVIHAKVNYCYVSQKRHNETSLLCYVLLKSRMYTLFHPPRMCTGFISVENYKS